MSIFDPYRIKKHKKRVSRKGRVNQIKPYEQHYAIDGQSFRESMFIVRSMGYNPVPNSLWNDVYLVNVCTSMTFNIPSTLGVSNMISYKFNNLIVNAYIMQAIRDSWTQQQPSIWNFNSNNFTSGRFTIGLESVSLYFSVGANTNNLTVAMYLRGNTQFISSVNSRIPCRSVTLTPHEIRPSYILADRTTGSEASPFQQQEINLGTYSQELDTLASSSNFSSTPVQVYNQFKQNDWGSFNLPLSDSELFGAELSDEDTYFYGGSFIVSFGLQLK